jgi:ribonuclease HII
MGFGVVPTLQIESTFKGLVGGVDEVGRGPWAGPVVAAVAVFLDPPSLPSFLLEGIQDSKKLSKPKRNFIYDALCKLEAFHYGIGSASVEEIDRLNILRAIFLAMKRAFDTLPQKPPTLLIDGRDIPSFEGVQTHPVVGGDDISLSIAAASIIAKVTRDKLMEDLAQTYPLYGWERNAGYGTQQHQEALKIHGVTPHHRRSFAPIKALL